MMPSRIVFRTSTANSPVRQPALPVPAYREVYGAAQDGGRERWEPRRDLVACVTSRQRSHRPATRRSMDVGLTGGMQQSGEGESSTPRLPPSAGEVEGTLAHLERLCRRLEEAEQRFKQLTDECEGVLKGLVAVDRRHASVVAGLNDRLSDWCHLESKLLEESARRIEQFERGVGHEWMALRQLHEEPLAQLKDEADQLRLACLEAARTARYRFDSAEKAYTTFAADLERRLGDWSRELVNAVRAASAGDAGSRPALPGSSLALHGATGIQPWPLEGVAQLHHELRTGSQVSTPGDGGAAPSPQPAAAAKRPVPEDAADDRSAVRTWPLRVTSRTAVILGIAGLVTLSLGGFALMRPSRGATEAVTSAAPQSAAAEQAPQAGEPSPPDGRLAEAQLAAERAGAMVEILAAADLRRYALAGVLPSAPGQPYGQVLWSRSRGLAASASRLPALPEGKVYRLWIVPDGPPVTAGVLAPDPAGRASLLLTGPLKLPLPVTIRVTVEDRGEVTTPRGPVVLARVPTS